jgi:HPt (histidine-containing phosphotransfer) domain-containing protein
MMSNKFLSIPEVQDGIHILSEKAGFTIEEARNIFNEFVTVYAQKLDEILECIQDKNFEKLAEKAHSLKGTFLNLYLPECAGLSIELEKNAKEKNIDACLSIIEKLNKATDLSD